MRQTFGIAIFKISVLHIDENERKQSVVKYNLTKELLVKHIEDRKSMQLVSASATADVWLEPISAAVEVDQRFQKTVDYGD